MADSLQEFAQFTQWIQHGAKWPPTFELSYWQRVNCIHHCHFLLLLSPKADTYFTWYLFYHPTVGRFSRSRQLLHTAVLPARRWSTIQVLTGPSRVTLLIETNMLLLSQTANHCDITSLLYFIYLQTIYCLITTNSNNSNSTCKMVRCLRMAHWHIQQTCWLWWLCSFSYISCV